MKLENQNNDEQILRLIQLDAKMEEGISLLIRTHQERIYAHVRRMVRTHEDAADIVQNIFIKVYGAIEKFQGKSKLSTWLYRIATNETLTFLKRNKNHYYPGEENESRLTLLQAEAYVEESEITRLLKKAIENLPERQKLVFNMRYFDEMPYDEISSILKVKTGGLKASFHHAMKKIENYVKENQMI